MLYRLYLVCLTTLAHCFFQPISDASPNSGKDLQIILNRWTVDLWRTFLVSLKEGEGWRTRNGFTRGLKRSRQCLSPPTKQLQINTLVPPDTVCMIPAVPPPISMHNAAALSLSTCLIWDICYFLPCGKIAGCGSSLQLCSPKLACKRTEASGEFQDTLSPKGGHNPAAFLHFRRKPV